MSRLKLTWGLVALLCATGVGAIIHQRHLLVQLRAHLAELRRGRQELAGLALDNTQLANQQPREEDAAALLRARAAAVALRQKIDLLERASRTSGANTETEARLPEAAWKFAGQGKPRDTLESLLWSASRGDVDQLSALIRFDAATRAQADAFFTQLPEAIRQQYGSPEKVCATMFAGSMPTDISAVGIVHEDDSVPDWSTELVQVEQAGGVTKDLFLNFVKGPQGWQIVVPARVLAGYERQLTGIAAPDAGAPGAAVALPAVSAAAGR